jgi:hypothetical protein
VRKVKHYFGASRTLTKGARAYQMRQARNIIESKLREVTKEALGDTPFKLYMGDGFMPDDWAIEVKTFDGYAWIEGSDPNFEKRILQYSSHPLEELAPLHLLEDLR